METAAASRDGTLVGALTSELLQEAEVTRRVLARVPEDRLSWRPHERSFSLGELACHVALIPRGIAELLRELEVQVPDVPRPEATSVATLLDALDESVAVATAALREWGDEGLQAEWTMLAGTTPLLTLPRMSMVRSLMLNHWYHHRGQLTVYLRPLDVPVPSVYGPSADEDR